MSIITRTRPAVKPARPFAAGLLDPETGRVARPEPYTAADLAWAAAAFHAAEPDYDRMAGEALALDRHERGLVF